MTDILTTIGQSLVHHGPANDRAYLMKLGGGDPRGLVADLESLAARKGYSKIIAKVPEKVRKPFEKEGFDTEATIPGYFRGAEDAHFMAKYRCPSRCRPVDPERIDAVLAAARAKAGSATPACLEDGYLWRPAGPEDAEAMAEVYRQVFATYPFPIHDPAYLRRTMQENIAYFGIWQDGKLMALSSAEMDRDSASAEMTDFATLPECRGGGLATFLLSRMEEEMATRGIRTAFTIARAVSFGMNITFSRSGYRFGGTLTRNTNISGDLECMNIWHKSLP